MDITSKRTSIPRRPAALSVLVGLSLLGGVPLIASQVVPTAADAMRRTRGSTVPSSRLATRRAASRPGLSPRTSSRWLCGRRGEGTGKAIGNIAFVTVPPSLPDEGSVAEPPSVYAPNHAARGDERRFEASYRNFRVRMRQCFDRASYGGWDARMADGEGITFRESSRPRLPPRFRLLLPFRQRLSPQRSHSQLD